MFGIHTNNRLGITYGIKTSSGYQWTIATDGHTSDSSISIIEEICDCKRLGRPVGHIPNPRYTIVRPGDDKPPIRGEREGADLLRVAMERVADLFLGDVPNLEHQKPCFVSIPLVMATAM